MLRIMYNFAQSFQSFSATITLEDINKNTTMPYKPIICYLSHRIMHFDEDKDSNCLKN